MPQLDKVTFLSQFFWYLRLLGIFMMHKTRNSSSPEVLNPSAAVLQELDGNETRCKGDPGGAPLPWALGLYRP